MGITININSFEKKKLRDFWNKTKMVRRA